MTTRGRISPTSGFRAIAGGILWVGFASWSGADLRTLAWSTALLTFAALVLMPLLVDLATEDNEGGAGPKLLTAICWLQLPAALLLELACLQPLGWLAAGLAMPWIILTGLLALVGAGRIFRRGITPWWAVCRDAGLVFIAVGGAWTLADRLGLHPLGFGLDIVQLTAVHFHFAGLVLPIVTGLVIKETPQSRVATVAGGGVLAGVPLVAVGITTSQLGWSHGMELGAGLVLAASAMTVAVLQLRLALENRWPRKVRILWTVAGLSLLFGMSLALFYAARFYGMPLPWLDLPWMRALHGTANALGFALCSTLAWRMAVKA